MKRRVTHDPWSAAAFALWAVCLTVTNATPAGRPAWADFLLGMLTAAFLLLFLRGLLGSTVRGRRLLERLRALKKGLAGKGAA